MSGICHMVINQLLYHRVLKMRFQTKFILFRATPCILKHNLVYSVYRYIFKFKKTPSHFIMYYITSVLIQLANLLELLLSKSGIQYLYFGYCYNNEIFFTLPSMVFFFLCFGFVITGFQTLALPIFKQCNHSD